MLRSPKYTNLTNVVPVACIVFLRRNCILLLQRRASLKDMDLAGLVAESVATVPEQREYSLCMWVMNSKRKIDS